MKLAEALILRADLQTRREELRGRLVNNALVQEGEKPAEDPALLLKELEGVCAQLEELVGRINLTNAAVLLEGRTLTQQLARREALAQKVSILRSLLDAASRTVMRGSRNEVKVRSTVDVAGLRKQADDLSEELRRLDTAIQGANWLEDLR